MREQIIKATHDFYDTTEKGTEWNLFEESAINATLDMTAHHITLHEALSWNFGPDAVLEIEWFLHHPSINQGDIN